MTDEHEPPEGYAVKDYGRWKGQRHGYAPEDWERLGSRASTLAWTGPDREARAEAVADAEEHARRRFMVVFGGTDPEETHALWLEARDIEEAGREALLRLAGDPSKWTVDRTEMYDCDDLVEVQYNGHQPLALEWGGDVAVIVEVHRRIDIDRLSSEAESARDDVLADESGARERAEYERLKKIYG